MDKWTFVIGRRDVCVINSRCLLRLTAVLIVLSFMGTFFCTAQEITKQERLKNTLYLQADNYSSAKDGVLAVIDKQDKSVTPKMLDGVFYVPLRYVLESFGVEVGWEDESKCVTISGGGKKLSLSVKDDEVRLGALKEKLSFDCFIDNERTYLALEDVSKLIKCNTHFYSSHKAAVIAVGQSWDSERDAEKQAHSAMEFAISPFFKMFT